MRTTFILMLAFAATMFIPSCGGDGEVTTPTKPAVTTHIGTWRVDKKLLEERSVALFLKSMETHFGGPIPPQEQKLVDGDVAKHRVQSRASTFTLVVAADGTWISSGLVGPDEISAKGTWTIAGDQLTFTTLEGGATEGGYPGRWETKSGTWAGDTIELKQVRGSDERAVTLLGG